MDLSSDHFRPMHKIFLITAFDLYFNVQLLKKPLVLKKRLLLRRKLMQVEYGYLLTFKLTLFDYLNVQKKESSCIILKIHF